MKILWIAHRDPLNPKAGGAEKIQYEVCTRLANNGNTISILAGGWKNCVRNEILNGIRIMRYGKRVGPHIVLPLHLVRNRYDAIIADLGQAVPWMSPVILRRKTIVAFLHLHARSLPGQANRVLAHLIMALEKLYPIIYSKSQFVTISRTSYVDLNDLGVKGEKITIIHPGVNNEFFHPSEKTKEPSIVYFGGMRPYKRPEEVLYLLKKLSKEIKNIRLTLIGDGLSRQGVERLCKDLDLTENVVFTGRVSDRKVAEVVASSWLNVHSSLTEGWGISIIEAASAGTPTVAYSVPGVSETVENGLNGITVRNGNLDALVDAALMILNNPKGWWSSSSEVAKKYSWDRTAELWEDLINKVAKG